MKLTFLKPSFAEKSDKVKVTFEVDAADVSQIMTLKQGESYEIAPYSQEVAEGKQTPTEKLETAQRLISEVLMCDTNEPELPLEENHCGNCGEFVADERENADPDGHCNWNGAPTHSRIIACDDWKALKTVKKCCGTCAEWTELGKFNEEDGSDGSCAIKDIVVFDNQGTDCDKWKEG